ncbi:hypothetical protein P12x_005512 [Tundrisphaera lichenicola]|uniref:hypothetical protein n=1 Tax=Tundrisphaera lichenicola TaxID=2029860 RepID=UPI003EC01285
MRFPRFRAPISSFRALLGLVVLVGLGLGVVVMPYVGHLRRLAEVRRLGGLATTAPCWQARLIDDRSTGPVIGAVFDVPLDDYGMEFIGRLVELEDLEVDAGLAADDGLSALESLVNLRRLTLTGPGLTDDSLYHVQKLIHLEELSLIDLPITDEGLGRLAPLDRLRVLSISRANFEGGGLDYLQELPGLREIRLIDNPEFNNRGVAHLQGATQLLSVSLEANPNLSDSGLGCLKPMTHLARLSVVSPTGTSFSRRKIREVESALRWTKVAIDSPDADRTW